MTLELLKWMQDAGLAVCLGLLGLEAWDRVMPPEDDSPQTRAARQPDVVRAARRAGACQRRHDRLEGRSGVWAAIRRRHHWRAYQRWLRVLQRRYWRHLRRMRDRWDPCEVTILLILSIGALGFMMMMAMIVETGAR